MRLLSAVPPVAPHKSQVDNISNSTASKDLEYEFEYAGERASMCWVHEGEPAENMASLLQVPQASLSSIRLRVLILCFLLQAASGTLRGTTRPAAL